MKYFKLVFLLVAVMLLSCEDEKDSIDLFGGEGKSKIVGMSSELKVKTGWNRIFLSWENSLDPSIKNIEVTWTGNKESEVEILPGDATEYIINDLNNFDYQINIVALDEDGKKSKSLTTYSRPYTKDHEILNTFLNVERKFFFVNDQLIILPNPYNPKMIKSTLHYYVGEEEQIVEFTEELCNETFIIYENVNKNKPVTFSRIAQIEECEDDILFEPYELSAEKVVLDPYFEDELKYQYNLKSISKEWINTIEELYIDFEIPTLEDIAYFPNLKRIKFGSKRFFIADPFGGEEGEESGGELMMPSFNFSPDHQELTIYILNELAKGDEGIDIEIYNDLFSLSDQLDQVLQKPAPVFSEKVYLNEDYKNWSAWEDPEPTLYTWCMPIDFFNPSKMWMSPFKNKEPQTHKLSVDMSEDKSINGFVVEFNNFGNLPSFPAKVNIQTSTDGNVWNNIDSDRSLLRVGNHYGERTNFELSAPITARYVRFIASDGGPISGMFYVTTVKSLLIY